MITMRKGYYSRDSLRFIRTGEMSSIPALHMSIVDMTWKSKYELQKQNMSLAQHGTDGQIKASGQALRSKEVTNLLRPIRPLINVSRSDFLIQHNPTLTSERFTVPMKTENKQEGIVKNDERKI